MTLTSPDPDGGIFELMTSRELSDEYHGAPDDGVPWDETERYTVHGWQLGLDASDPGHVSAPLAEAEDVGGAELAVRTLRDEDPYLGPLGIRDTVEQRWVLYPW